MKSLKLLAIALTLTFNLSAQFCSDEDKSYIKELWVDFNEPALTNWDFNNPVPLDNTWQGITMTADGCNVEEINLINAGLTGTISPVIELLQNLVVVNLSVNDIVGGIPEEIGNLGQLEDLTLFNNDLTGNIPGELSMLSNLRVLNLGANFLSGNLEPALANLNNLELLRLPTNNLSGSIPTSFGQFQSIREINLTGNNIGGSIPPELAGANTLESIRLNSNLLSGPIPAELEQLSNLVIFQSASNNHTGTLPEIEFNLGSINILSLNDNNFSGCIPESYLDWCQVESNVSLANNPMLDNDDFSTFCSSGLGMCVDPADDFVTTWKTTNPGSSNDQTIFIPTVGSTSYSYNYDVDWDNDGVFEDFGVTGSISHTYPSPGQYTVRIRGEFPRIYFNNNFDKDKIVSIDQWGNKEWVSMFRAFWGCSNLSIFATDSPDLSQMSSMVLAFADIGPFQADLSGWDVSTITSMSGMLQDSELSTENYDALLIAWSQQSLQSNILFHAGTSEYCNGGMARQSILDNYNWNLTDGGLDDDCHINDFVTTWKTNNPGSSNDQTIFIPTVGSASYSYDYDVDWDNDGVFEDFGVTGSISHTYPSPGQYTVRIRGEFPRIYFNNNFDKDKIVSIDQWGNSEWVSMFRAFWGCSNLSVFATDSPDLSEMNNMVLMFAECGPIDADLSDWDVSTITSMSGMLQDSELSTENYDALLIAWSQQSLQSNILFHAGSSQYCDGQYARQDILDIYNWNITDGGPGTGCNPDIDGDGSLNDDDCDPYDPTFFIGATCDDGNPSTSVDVVGADCICIGYNPTADCSMAIPISEGITYSPGVAVLGGPSATNNCFASIGTNAVWYAYTATVCDTVTVSSSIDPSLPDTRLSIHSDCSNLDCITADDDSGYGFTSVTTFVAEAGQTYYLEWDDRWNDEEFTFEISAPIDTCPTDFTGDGQTNGQDFAIFLGNFGLTCTDPCGCPTDLNGDGITDGDDFVIYLGNNGLQCPQ